MVRTEIEALVERMFLEDEEWNCKKKKSKEYKMGESINVLKFVHSKKSKKIQIVTPDNWHTWVNRVSPVDNWPSTYKLLNFDNKN